MSACLRGVLRLSPGGYLLVNPQNTVTGGGARSVSNIAAHRRSPYRSPRGMCVTTVVLSTCARSGNLALLGKADCARIGRAHRFHARVARPTGALSQVAARYGVMSGSRMSTWTQLVAKAVQPLRTADPSC
jgi:hypothetical protein